MPFLTGLVKNTPAGYFLLQPTLTDNLLFLAHNHKFFSPLLLPATAASGLKPLMDRIKLSQSAYLVLVECNAAETSSGSHYSKLDSEDSCRSVVQLQQGYMCTTRYVHYRYMCTIWEPLNSGGKSDFPAKIVTASVRSTSTHVHDHYCSPHRDHTTIARSRTRPQPLSLHRDHVASSWSRSWPLFSSLQPHNCHETYLCPVTYVPCTTCNQASIKAFFTK
jgi:hypothetical protein